MPTFHHTQMLLLILSFADEPATVAEFSKTCKSMLAVATDPVFMADWLMRFCRSKALHVAGQQMKRSDVMLMLLQKGVSATALTDTAEPSSTPMELALQNGFMDVLAYLWQRPEVRREEQAAANVLVSAACKGNAACLELLLAPPSPLSVRSKSTVGWLPLQMAVESARSVEAVQVLLAYGASCLPCSSYTYMGKSVIHMACGTTFFSSHLKDPLLDEADRASIVRMLFDETPDGLSMIDARDKDGLTPLHVAALHGLPSVCETLCRFGSTSVNARDNDGQSPFKTSVNSPFFFLSFPYKYAAVQEVLVRFGSDQT